VFTKGVAAVTAISDHPAGHVWQLIEKSYGVRQFVRLPGRQDEGHGAAYGVGDDARSISEAD
jgi:hypothetical protein